MDEPAKVSTGDRLCALTVWTICVGVIIVFLWAVVPKFAQGFAAGGFEMPAPTKLTVGAASWTMRYWPVTIAAYFVIGLGVSTSKHFRIPPWTQPLVIIMLGVLVGFIVVCLFMPQCTILQGVKP